MSIPVGNTYDKEATAHPVERRLVRGFTRALHDLLPPYAAQVLEVGCGEGGQLRKLSHALPGARIVGLDLPSEQLASCWTGIDAHMVCGSAAALPFPDAAFDLVVALEVLEHVAHPDAALAEIARVASGTVVLSVPWEPVWRIGNLARGRYVRHMGNTPGHVQHFSRRGFVRRVAAHLAVDRVRRPVPWTFVGARVRVRGVADGRAGGRRQLLHLAGALLAVVAVVFVAAEVGEQWPALSAAVADAAWPVVVVAAAVFVAGELAFAATWPVTLRALGASARWAWATSTFVVTQTAKYVPGGVWPALSRVGVCSGAGIPARVSTSGLAVETGAVVAAALVISGAWGTTATLVVDEPPGWLRVAEPLAAAVLAGGALVATRLAARRLHAVPPLAAHARLAGWHLGVFAAWCTGAALLAVAIGADARPVPGAFALSWLAGFVVVGAPAGLGVREAVMTAALAPTLGQADALAVALGSRALWTFVQLGAALVGAAALARGARRAATPIRTIGGSA